MRSLLFIILFGSAQGFASEVVSFKNDREGVSYYSSNSDKRSISRALREVRDTDIDLAFDETLKTQEASKLCTFTLNETLHDNLKRINPNFDEMEGAILYLRSKNQMDDVVTKLLLEANKTVTTDILLPKQQEKLFLPSNKETVKKAVDIIAGIEKKLSTTCFDEAYKNLYNEVFRLDKGLKDHHLEALLVEAYKLKKISFDLYLSLEQARVTELQTSILTLKAYHRKVKSLRVQYPLRDSNEQSNFVTGKVDKAKLSRRQRLMEGYTDLQIMLMANVVKKLRTRLDSPKVEILIYDRTQGIETITLEPMERFRLAIKLLRKEMAELALNTYFAGRSPDYMDLMTAAYETGLIPASELEEVAGLQDIWNPKKTFWEKASVWVRTLSSVATIAIPPPYGFIPALAIVVIEMTAGKKDPKTDDPTVLF